MKHRKRTPFFLVTVVAVILCLVVENTIAVNVSHANELSSSSSNKDPREPSMTTTMGSNVFFFNQYEFVYPSQYCLYELFAGVVYNYTRGEDQPAFYGGYDSNSGGFVAHAIFNAYYPEQTVHTLSTTNLTTFSTQYVNLTGIEPQAGVFSLLWDPYSEQMVLFAFGYSGQHSRNITFYAYSFDEATGSTSLLGSGLLDTTDLETVPIGFVSDTKGGLYLFYQQFTDYNTSVPAVTGALVLDQTTGVVSIVSTAEYPYIIDSIGYNSDRSQVHQAPVFSAAIVKDDVGFLMEVLYQPDDNLWYNYTLVPLDGVSSSDFSFFGDSWSSDGSLLYHYGSGTSSFYTIETLSGKVLSKYDVPYQRGLLVSGVTVS